MKRAVFIFALAYALPANAGLEITGSVTYKGKAPTNKLLDRSSEAACAKNKAYANDVVVDQKGGLEGVLVRIKNGTAGKHKAPKAPVVIRQEDCTYSPRVQGIVSGQALSIENSDGFMHNVHAKLGGETWFNRSQPKGAPPIKQTDYGAAGEVLTLGCDVHSWMRAFVAVHDHPFFTVTKDDGTFRLQVPQGKAFTIEAWHPTLGLKSVTAKPGAKISLVFP